MKSGKLGSHIWNQMKKHFFSNPDENLQSATEESDKETCTVQKMEVIGSIKKVENNDEDELLKDVESSFDVHVKKGQAQTKTQNLNLVFL